MSRSPELRSSGAVLECSCRCSTRAFLAIDAFHIALYASVLLTSRLFRVLLRGRYPHTSRRPHAAGAADHVVHSHSQAGVPTSRVAGSFSVVLGCAVLFGFWILDLEFRIHSLSLSLDMAPSTFSNPRHFFGTSGTPIDFSPFRPSHSAEGELHFGPTFCFPFKAKSIQGSSLFSKPQAVYLNVGVQSVGYVLFG